MENRPKPSKLAKFLQSKRTQQIIEFVLVPLLLLSSLFLPPAALGDRLFHWDHTLAKAGQDTVIDGPDGVSLAIASADATGKCRLLVETVGEDIPGADRDGSLFVTAATTGAASDYADDSVEIIAAEAMPSDLDISSAIYHVSLYGNEPDASTITLPLDDSEIELTDVYVWEDGAWTWVPSSYSDETISATVSGVPELVMTTQAVPTVLSLSADSSEAASAIGARTVFAASVAIDETGSAIDEISAAPEGVQAMLTINNVIDGVVRSDLITNLISNPDNVSAAVASLVNTCKAAGYEGLELNLDGLSADLADEYVAFVSSLADALHEQGLVLAINLDEEQTNYDWQALGAVADAIRIPLITTDVADFSPTGKAETFMTWATHQVNRSKVELVFSADAAIVSDSAVNYTSYYDALLLLGSELALDNSNGLYEPGDTIIVTMADVESNALFYDEESLTYYFNNGDDTVILETGSSMSRKLNLLSQFAVAGLGLEDWAEDASDPDIVVALDTYTDDIAVSAAQYAMIYTLSEQDSAEPEATVVAQLTDPEQSWTAPNNPGEYVISALISTDGGETALEAVATAEFIVPSPTPSPTPTNTPTLTPVPTAAASTSSGSSSGSDATTAPVATAVPSYGSTGNYFGYGIQADLITDTNYDRTLGAVSDIGFNWVKQQVEWFRYNPSPGVYDWGALDAIVDQANARGINILFSVVKAPSWARPAGDTDQGPPSDPATYATFMRELAARYAGRVQAYEIWNEQNLYYEWGGLGNKLNAANYVELLKAAYSAVKSVDSSAVVISGALTPTGVNDGNIAIDDRAYLEQMYQAGLRYYCDAVGAHPSGYNNPPDADWQTYSDPSTSACKGHPSWFFRGTMESYRNIMVAYGDSSKRVWVTEFGWATVDGLGVSPATGYEYASDNTEAEQAAFIVQAYQLGKSWGWVGPMFLWNLNFAPVAGNADEKAAFGIVRGDWSARAAYSALRDMAKW